MHSRCPTPAPSQQPQHPHPDAAYRGFWDGVQTKLTGFFGTPNKSLPAFPCPGQLPCSPVSFQLSVLRAQRVRRFCPALTASSVKQIRHLRNWDPMGQPRTKAPMPRHPG